MAAGKYIKFLSANDTDLDEMEEELLRKCVVFYAAIDSLTNHKIKTDLLPVLTKRDSFDLETAKKVYASDKLRNSSGRWNYSNRNTLMPIVSE